MYCLIEVPGWFRWANGVNRGDGSLGERLCVSKSEILWSWTVCSSARRQTHHKKGCSVSPLRYRRNWTWAWDVWLISRWPVKCLTLKILLDPRTSSQSIHTADPTSMTSCSERHHSTSVPSFLTSSAWLAFSNDSTFISSHKTLVVRKPRQGLLRTCCEHVLVTQTSLVSMLASDNISRANQASFISSTTEIPFKS